MSQRVLLVDDDWLYRSDLAEMVASFGFDVTVASDGKEALDRQSSFPSDVILTDLVMPRMDGASFLRALVARGDRTPAIVFSEFGNLEKAIWLVHELNAFWFLEKPVQANVMRTLLEGAVRHNLLIEETELLNRRLADKCVREEMLGESPVMKEIFSQIRQVARTTACVFISGESGTGKELVARAIHRLSPGNAGPFIAINCAALPEALVESELFGHEKGAFTGAFERRAGCFEQAHDGTLLLDEITEMPGGAQAKLLRVIEESKVRRLGGGTDTSFSARVLAATNRSPDEAIRNNHLRKDLYYRLNVFHIHLPPLRERREDIPAISEAMIGHLNRKHASRVTGLSPDVLRQFDDASWPGNVRELRNVIERAVIRAEEGEIQLAHVTGSFLGALPPPAPALVPRALPEGVLHMPVGSRMEEVQEAYLRLTLKHTRNNKTHAAEMLGLSLRTLHNRIASGRTKQ